MIAYQIERAAGKNADKINGRNFVTLRNAMHYIALVYAHPMARESVCRTRPVDGEWYVYRRPADRLADRNGAAPHLLLAVVRRVKVEQ